MTRRGHHNKIKINKYIYIYIPADHFHDITARSYLNSLRNNENLGILPANKDNATGVNKTKNYDANTKNIITYQISYNL